MNKDKKKLFFLNAPYVEDNGTYGELLELFMLHPQTDEEILKSACEKISDYINFSMSISVYYWCEEREDYHQYFPEGTKMNYNKWKLHVIGNNTVITENTTNFDDYHVENLSDLVEMFKTENRLKSNSKGKYPYEHLFNYLLDGKA